MYSCRNRCDIIASLVKFSAKSDNRDDLPPLIIRSKDTCTSDRSQPGQPKKPLIEEISAKQAASCAPELPQGKSEKLTIPTHSVSVKEPDSKHPTQRVLVKVALPGVSSVDQVDLEVSKVSWYTPHPPGVLPNQSQPREGTCNMRISRMP